MARNPGAMREMMRSQDRQLSNIEVSGRGFRKCSHDRLGLSGKTKQSIGPL